MTQIFLPPLTKYFSPRLQAVERLVEPPEVKHERLLVVSILGFLVNLVGIFVFQVRRPR